MSLRWQGQHAAGLMGAKMMGRCKLTAARLRVQTSLILGVLLLAAAMSVAPKAVASEAETLLVLDYEFDGDPGDATMLAERKRRMARMSDVLRTALGAAGLYRVIDSPALRAQIARVGATQYLHRCNGCELDLARAAGARYVLIPWVFRMSQLVVTMHFEVKDVSTGKLVMKRALDFRNDADASWEREIKFLIRDMREGKRWN